jgi:hypothetical protein
MPSAMTSSRPSIFGSRSAKLPAELGHLRALVGHLERHVAGAGGGAGDLARVVSGLDRDRVLVGLSKAQLISI